MNQLTMPSRHKAVNHASVLDQLAGELVHKFDFSKETHSRQNKSLLTQILHFAAEAEQTIAEQKKHIEELESLAASDALTGLLNRRGLEMELQHALAASQRYGDQGLFVYIDLNDFKSVNDTYGHAAGDALLQHVAQCLKSSLRSTDYAARLGGDEFGLLLSRCIPEQAAARIRHILQSLENTPCLFKGQKLWASASFGSAKIASDSTIDAILNHADRDMYRHKKGQPQKSRIRA